MKKLLLITGLILIAFKGQILAQCEGEFEKLHIMYVDDKKYKLLDKSLGMMDKDKYKKEPLVYLYIAIAYYEISKDPDRDMEEFKAPYKQAVKFAAKFRKKDKKKVYENCEPDFWNEIKRIANEDIRNGFLGIEEDITGTDKTAKANSKEMKKAFKRAKSYVKFAPEQIGAWFIKAVGEDITGKTKDIEVSIKEGKRLLDSTDLDILEPVDKDILLFGIITYAKYQKVHKGNPSEAKAIMEKIKAMFEDDDEYLDALDIVNK